MQAMQSFPISLSFIRYFLAQQCLFWSTNTEIIKFLLKFSGNVYQFTFGVISCISVRYCGARFGFSRQTLAVVYVCTIPMMQHRRSKVSV